MPGDRSTVRFILRFDLSPSRRSRESTATIRRRNEISAGLPGIAAVPVALSVFCLVFSVLRREIEVAVMSFVTGFHTTSSEDCSAHRDVGERFGSVGVYDLHARLTQAILRFPSLRVFHFVSWIVSNRV